MNLPSSLPWWIIVIGAIVAIGVGKMSFGGLGGNIFNPALPFAPTPRLTDCKHCPYRTLCGR